MRAHLERDFDALYVINLHGNIRKDSMRDRIPLGERHTVFGLAAMVGISISFMVRNGGKRKGVFYSECDFRSTREEKFNLLAKWNSTAGVPWKAIEPDKNHNWLTWEEKRDFTGFAPIGDNAAKAGSKTSRTFFEIFSLGVVTSRDSWVYSFSAPILLENVKRLVSIYNSEVGRLQAADSKNEKLSDELKWTDRLKDALSNREHINVRASGVRKALYRPFTSKFLYFDHLLNQRRYLQYLIFPNENSEAENLSICVTGPASEKPFLALASNLIPDLHLSSPGCGTQCFPFYTYAEDGTNRRENITDWALEQFRSHYADPSITKWDIFHYVYAVLHHPEYRTRYAANLRRELPRIPFVSTTNSNQCHSEPGKQPGEEPAGLSGAGKKQVPPVGRNDNTLSSAVTKDIGVFRAFVKAGQRLAEIHVHYEKQPEYPLTKTEKAGEKLDYRVERMKLSKDKTTLTYNRFLTLSGIPKETYDYRLGNRSALEWIVDQYQVSTDKRSGITNDPNRADDPTYILRLIGQVVTVSLETVKIVASLPPMGLSSTEASAAAAPLT